MYFDQQSIKKQGQSVRQYLSCLCKLSVLSLQLIAHLYSKNCFLKNMQKVRSLWILVKRGSILCVVSIIKLVLGGLLMFEWLLRRMESYVH